MNDLEFVLGRVSNATLEARRISPRNQISNLIKRTFQPEKTAEIAFQMRNWEGGSHV